MNRMCRPGVLGGEIFRRELGHALGRLDDVGGGALPGERQIGELGHRIAAGRHAVQHPGDVGDAVARRIELPVRRADELAVRIDGELQPAVGFLFELLGPGRHPFVEGVLRRHEMRQLELDGLRLGAARERTATSTATDSAASVMDRSSGIDVLPDGFFCLPTMRERIALGNAAHSGGWAGRLGRSSRGAGPPRSRTSPPARRRARTR